jgi:hypothetical protein
MNALSFLFFEFLLEIPFEICRNFFVGLSRISFWVFPAFNEPGIPGMQGKSPVLHYMVIILLIRGSSRSHKNLPRITQSQQPAANEYNK